MYDGVSRADPTPDVVKLAVEPLYRMLRSREPFDDCPAARDLLSPICDRIRTVGTWAYQFHTYLDLIEGEHGAGTRRQVEQVILHSLNQQGGAGDQLERFLRLTQNAIADYDQRLTQGGRNIGLSVETYLAITLLIKTPDSPYFSGCGDQEVTRETPMEFDVLKDLSRCFKRGAERVRIHYQARFCHAGEQVH